VLRQIACMAADGMCCSEHLMHVCVLRLADIVWILCVPRSPLSTMSALNVLPPSHDLQSTSSAGVWRYWMMRRVWDGWPVSQGRARPNRALPLRLPMQPAWRCGLATCFVHMPWPPRTPGHAHQLQVPHVLNLALDVKCGLASLSTGRIGLMSSDHVSSPCHDQKPCNTIAGGG
jgi:hypothetical protein